VLSVIVNGAFKPTGSQGAASQRPARTAALSGHSFSFFSGKARTLLEAR
jgi:hypothetical protein